MCTARFTVTGSDALEHRLANICRQVSAGIRRVIPGHTLVGIALGGGYGRGEGGVLKTPAGDQPYNDLEFYVFVRRHPWLNDRRYGRALHQLGADLEGAAGVELEFKIISTAILQNSPPSLFFHDLIVGHRWLMGDDGLLAGCEHHREGQFLPLSEATRLLMNRCSGLLFAQERLERARFQPEDADFVARNIAKTELALGDAILIAFGKYHWSCRERERRLRDLADPCGLECLDEVRQRHAAGIAFKLLPHRSEASREVLAARLEAIKPLALTVWLWLENRRLDGVFGSALDYVSSEINKWPGSGCLRNWAANVRVFGLRALVTPRSLRHPRERILNALVRLLWGHRGDSRDLNRALQRELLSRRPALVSTYRERWRRVS
jgi:hypothetical protein